jgi:L-ascorbate metabolism protein UlaG (beta-lactamase superfamily)
MSTKIHWIHHASFRLSTPDCCLYIDPWKLTSEPHDADVIFISHNHYDHCSPEDIKKVSNDATAIIAPAETIKELHAANAVAPGERMTIKDVTIEAVAAYNVGKRFHPASNHWCGAVFTLGPQRIYYAGDTDLIPEMADLQDIDVALLPVGGTYTLDAAEAADACRAIDCPVAIPYHWGDIVGSMADAQAFHDAAGCEVRLLQPGEVTEI